MMEYQQEEEEEEEGRKSTLRRRWADTQTTRVLFIRRGLFTTITSYGQFTTICLIRSNMYLGNYDRIKLNTF